MLVKRTPKNVIISKTVGIAKSKERAEEILNLQPVAIDGIVRYAILELPEQNVE